MHHRILAGTFVCLLILVECTAAQPAQRNTSKQPKAPVEAAQKPPRQPAALKSVTCKAGCGFMARSRSTRELRYLMKRHARKYHKVVLTDAQVKELIRKEGGH